MESNNYSNKDKCLRDYDSKCSGKPVNYLTECSTSGIWSMYLCKFHKVQISKEQQLSEDTWSKVEE
jgi:hypothetical protein